MEKRLRLVGFVSVFIFIMFILTVFLNSDVFAQTCKPGTRMCTGDSEWKWCNDNGEWVEGTLLSGGGINPYSCDRVVYYGREWDDLPDDAKNQISREDYIRMNTNQIDMEYPDVYCNQYHFAHPIDPCGGAGPENFETETDIFCSSEDCNNGVDDDANNLTDCKDPSCWNYCCNNPSLDFNEQCTRWQGVADPLCSSDEICLNCICQDDQSFSCERPEGGCYITRAYWTNRSYETRNPVPDIEVDESNEVYMIVEAIDYFGNCGGSLIYLNIFEDDLWPNPDDYVESVYGGVFPYTGGNIKKTALWTARWTDDGLFGDEPEYYFTVTSSPDTSPITGAVISKVVKTETGGRLDNFLNRLREITGGVIESVFVSGKAVVGLVSGQEIRGYVCGDCSCDPGETFKTCPRDCRAVSCISVGQECGTDVGWEPGQYFRCDECCTQYYEYDKGKFYCEIPPGVTEYCSDGYCSGNEIAEPTDCIDCAVISCAGQIAQCVSGGCACLAPEQVICPIDCLPTCGDGICDLRMNAFYCTGQFGEYPSCKKDCPDCSPLGTCTTYYPDPCPSGTVCVDINTRDGRYPQIIPSSSGQGYCCFPEAETPIPTLPEIEPFPSENLLIVRQVGVVCDNDGICDAGESLFNCPGDCRLDCTVDENCSYECPDNTIINGTCTSDNFCVMNGQCPPSTVCNYNIICDTGETFENCPGDCPFVECTVDENCVIICPDNTIINGTCINNRCAYDEQCPSIPINITNLTGAYWADMLNNPIDEADLNDRVKLMVAGEGIETKNIEYEVWKVDGGFLWFDSVEAQFSGVGFATWKANQTGDFYFKARVEGEEWIDSRDNDDYGVLTVSSTENNEPPHAEILIPKTGEIYLVGEVVEFIQESYDEDDVINYTWDFGDGSTSNQINTTHNYSSDGQKNILLKVEDERGERENDRTSILIVDPSQDGKYIFAHIAEPEWGESFYGSVVDFNATTSYAVEIEDGEISCIAGPCPNQTASDLIISGSPQSLDRLEFYWLFDNNPNDFRNKTGLEGALFTKGFPIPRRHWANLTISANPSESAATMFFTYLDDPFCIIEDGDSFWIGEYGETNSIDDCYKEIVAEGSAHNCCPAGFSCIKQNGYGICEFSDVWECANYTTEEDCEDYSYGTAKYDVDEKIGPDKYCGFFEYDEEQDCYEAIEDCRCQWVDGKCESAYNETNTCEDYSGTCIFTTIFLSNCTAGYKTVVWNATWYGSGEGPDECVEGSESVRCISVELAFFTLISLIISISLIVIFYLRKKER